MQDYETPNTLLNTKISNSDIFQYFCCLSRRKKKKKKLEISSSEDYVQLIFSAEPTTSINEPPFNPRSSMPSVIPPLKVKNEEIGTTRKSMMETGSLNEVIIVKPTVSRLKYHASLPEMSRFGIGRRRPTVTAKKLLPPKREDAPKKTLVLDLDETLIHSRYKKFEGYDFECKYESSEKGKWEKIYVAKRPGVDEFLQHCSNYFEIVVFTAGLENYANAIIDNLDKNKLIEHRLFRDSCTFRDGNYYKDLRNLGRNIDQVVIIDNSPICYDLQPTNAMPINTWKSSKFDDAFQVMLPWIKLIAETPDVYKPLSLFREKYPVTTEIVKKM